MPKIAPQLQCLPEVIEELKTIARSRSEELRKIERAKIILTCLDGKENKQVSAELGISIPTVGKWRRRFALHGMDGLKDAPKSGRPFTYDPALLRKRILALLDDPPPAGLACWDGPSIAEALNCSAYAVWRLLGKEGVCLQRKRSWCVSTDKEFVPKAADIIGLYLNPPENAFVICVDEKPSIQALERAVGYVQTDNGKIVRGYKSTYRRHGTLNLFAALEVATGHIQASTTELKRRVEFQQFMDDIVTETPPDRELHVILDNYCTHKKNDDWLARHPNVHFHFTPTSASWLNQVEIWFGIFSRKTLRGASFQNTEQLRKAIEAFIERYNPKAKPFRWRKREVKGAQLRNTITNLRD